jgi:hypothetical protein
MICAGAGVAMRLLGHKTASVFLRYDVAGDPVDPCAGKKGADRLCGP